MKPAQIIFCPVLMLLIAGCSKQADRVPHLPPGDAVNLSDLLTKHDYYLPFSVINNSSSVSSAVINNEPVSFAFGDFVEFTENGFFELITQNSSHQAVDTVLFTTKTEERESSEWGIRAWVPVHYTTTSLGTEDVEIYYPHRYADGIKVPFVFYVKEAGRLKAVYTTASCTTTGDNFNIKRGVGSVNIGVSAIAGKADFVIGGRQISRPLTKITGTPIMLQGTIAVATEIPANSFVRIAAGLTITSSGSLTIHEGTVMLIDEAVDINVSGAVLISGTADNPVFITCSDRDKFWGGFITRVSTGTIQARYAFFCQSGFHNSTGYNWGHSGRQALFYTENSTLNLDNCFMLDHVGQVFYPQNSVLKFNNILVQRVQTGGQINTSDLTLKNSVFADIPEESDIFLDSDNDALYLSASDAVIDSTTFMFAKDDGLDSGNTEGGTIIVTNSRFEANFHEGAALSSGNGAYKSHTFRNCIFTNCGQGLELGFSSPNHTVTADNCQFLNNGVGIRYGDNYAWANVEGKMIIKNSVSLGNDRDVWNMVRKSWSPKLDNLTFENTQVSGICHQYPGLPVKSQ